MQASSNSWVAPAGVLGGIIREAGPRVEALRRRRRAIEAAAAAAPTRPSFASALRTAHVAVIAEVKRRSPSKGVIRAGLSAAEQAHRYECGGASAVSILTEPAHFGGSAEDLESARSAVQIPVLRKDFTVDTLQIIEARALGASAVLLIARALHPDTLTALARHALDLGVEPLVEVRSRAELDVALEAGARVVGVNARDLETLILDRDLAATLLPLIPPEVIAVAESGVIGVEDVLRLAGSGADAVLVGSSVSAAPDPVAAVRALAAVPRTRSRG